MTRTDVPAAWDERTQLTTSIAGLVSHLRWVEYSWIQVMLLGEDDHGPWTDEEPDRGFTVALQTPLAYALDKCEQQCQRYRQLVVELDLDTRSKRTIRTGDSVDLRWILLQLIEETARHNGVTGD